MEGEKIVRRHRLAERLFTDVLDFKKDIIHSVSCKFEHLLHENMEDNICILLGHPRTCPHGRRIPPGECCRKSEKHAGKVVASLASLIGKAERQGCVYSDKRPQKAAKTDGNVDSAGPFNYSAADVPIVRFPDRPIAICN